MEIPHVRFGMTMFRIDVAARANIKRDEVVYPLVECRRMNREARLEMEAEIRLFFMSFRLK